MRQNDALELKNARALSPEVCEAAYVVAHARWRKQRGRKPSLAYGGERNPAKALEKAKAYLRLLTDGDVCCGVNIKDVILYWIKIAKAIGEPIVATFNDIQLAILTDLDVDEGFADYDKAWEDRVREWSESPEGQADAKARREKIENLQIEANRMMERLETLDLNDLDNAILWLYHFQNPSDTHGVVWDWERIVKIYAQYGYHANDCLHPNKDDLDQCGRYIVGQALACLESHVHAIHRIYRGAAEEWLEKYEAKLLQQSC